MEPAASPLGALPVLRLAGGLIRWAGYGLFFLMLFVPAAYQPVKGALLGLVLVGVLAGWVIRGHLGIDRRVLLASIAFAALGALFILRGHATGAPGALQMFNVYVTWPLVYLALISGFADASALRDLVRIIVVAANAIAAYSITFVLWSAGYWPDALYIELDQGQLIGFYDAYIEFGLYSTSSLMFVTPFLIAAVIIYSPDDAPVSRRTLWLSLAFSLVTVLLSGRRALIVLLPVAPVLALYFRWWLPAPMRLHTRRMLRRGFVGGVVLAVILGAVLTAVGSIAPGGFVEMVSTGFQFSTDPVAMSRRDQFVALIDGWAESPLLGAGHGAYAPSVIRSEETPWSYELTYVNLLFHTGLIGVAAYVAGAAWIGLMSYRIARRGWSEAPSLMVTLVGSASFMIANGTNPYLEKFDYIWVIFLPVAFINCYLVSRARAANGQ
jgi:hypothetical protein